MPQPSIDIKANSALHTKVCDALNARFQLSVTRMNVLHDKWPKAEEAFIAYVPETAADAKRRVKRENEGKPQYTTVILPYTYYQLMSAHSYWTTVFLSRDPVYQFSGRHGEAEDQVLAIEAMIAYQVQVGRQLVPYYLWLLDAGKYGIGVIGTYWDKEVSVVSQMVQRPKSFLGIPILGRTKPELVAQEVVGYQGNKVFNIRPYDYYPDPRVPLWDVQRGEFVGYHMEVGWNTLKR